MLDLPRNTSPSPQCIKYDRDLIGSLDLRKGDVTVEYTLPAMREVELIVTPLPEGTTIWPQLTDMLQDRDTGRITGHVVLPARFKSITFSASALGYVAGNVTIDVPPNDAPLHGRIEMLKGLECRVRKLGEMKRGRLEFQLAPAY